MLHAGAFYKQTKTVADDRPTLPEVQKNFELMEHHAAHLLALLDNMDDASWNSFWRAEDDIQQECVFQRSSPAMLEIGALRLVNEEQDDWEFYTRDDFPPVLKLAVLIARRARADLPAPVRGPKRQIALRRWVSSLCDLWESFGKTVTVTYEAGQARSETYEFLERLLKPLDQEALRYLATVLREERTRRRHSNGHYLFRNAPK